MAQITLRILAKELSLSVATVSKALADSHEISQATKDVVIATARRLDYVINPYASSLRKRCSRNIAVVIPEVTDSFFSEAINGIETVALRHGYHVLIYLTHESLERETAIMDELRSGRVDGILMSVSEETHCSGHIRKLISTSTPVIFFDRICEDVETACIVTNDFESSYLATLHLAEMGCKRIAILAPPVQLAISLKRLQGYRQAILDLGFEIEEKLCVFCSKKEDENRKAVFNLLSADNPPDAIIAGIEKMGVLVYSIAQELAIPIPEKLRLLTFANLRIAEFMDPPLSTIHQPAFEIGETAATLLFEALKYRKLPDCQQITIPSTFYCRKSSAG